MMDQAIALNRRLLGRSDQGMILNKKDCLPHISLAMGCIAGEAVPLIQTILGKIAQRFPKLDLTAIAVRAVTSPAGRTVSSIEIERTAGLQRLHEAVMSKLSPHFSYTVSPEMFFVFLADGVADETADATADATANTTIDKAAISWVENFPAQSSFTRFSPHITAGFGQTDYRLGPMRFRPASLALCQLGNFCTCRRILAAADLR
ncbi:MAG: hypothetical protein IH846_17685 [Acidobacteria bacterium]|nr:hypothetical protein [Acidobacteriota bacterium]